MTPSPTPKDDVRRRRPAPPPRRGGGRWLPLLRHRRAGLGAGLALGARGRATLRRASSAWCVNMSTAPKDAPPTAAAPRPPPRHGAGRCAAAAVVVTEAATAGARAAPAVGARAAAGQLCGGGGDGTRRPDGCNVATAARCVDYTQPQHCAAAIGGDTSSACASPGRRRAASLRRARADISAWDGASARLPASQSRASSFNADISCAPALTTRTASDARLRRTTFVSSGASRRRRLFGHPRVDPRSPTWIPS